MDGPAILSPHGDLTLLERARICQNAELEVERGSGGPGGCRGFLGAIPEFSCGMGSG